MISADFLRTVARVAIAAEARAREELEHGDGTRAAELRVLLESLDADTLRALFALALSGRERRTFEEQVARPWARPEDLVALLYAKQLLARWLRRGLERLDVPARLRPVARDAIAAMARPPGPFGSFRRFGRSGSATPVSRLDNGTH